MNHLSRRAVLAALAAAPILPTQSWAQERYLDVRPGGAFKPVRIAVAPFAGDAELARAMTGIIANNFKRSVFLAPVEGGPEQASAEGPPNFEVWRPTGAQFVLTGRTGRGPTGQLRTEFRLWDVSTGQQVAGQQYSTEGSVARRVAHIVSDQVFTRITGEKGWFDSRVVFVDETGPKDSRRKRVALMDQDGGATQYLTKGEDLVVTPRFSPSGGEVAYMSFGSADPKVTLFNLGSRSRQVLGEFSGMTFAPRFSPDGSKVVMSLSEGTSASLYAMDLRTRQTSRLTEASAIDTSPSYSPDASQIVFESDRGGTQQIYVMGANGGSAKRISFGEGRYSTPVWSPKGDLVAFTRQRGGSFAIGVMRPDGTAERTLAEGFHNEGPTFAPNGLYVMFFRDPSGSGGPRIHMIDVFGRGESPVPTPSFASDPSWGPLLG